MSWLDLSQTDESEEIDDPSHSYDEIVRSMKDVARANRIFWGTHTVLSHLAQILADVDRVKPIRVLDVATGSADIPQAMISWAKRRGHNLSVTAVDNMPSMLKMAQEAAPDVALVQADALRLPFAQRTFDLAVCALAFHHLRFDQCVSLLRAMDRLTTRGFIVSDLRRDRLALLAIQSGMRLIRSHPFTRYDAPTSVRRAYTPREYEKMIALSGVRNMRIYSHGYVRIALVQNKSTTI
jgi:ubiquinone/menaquinone biosynthesis C-methylase UbiE